MIREFFLLLQQSFRIFAASGSWFSIMDISLAAALLFLFLISFAISIAATCMFP